MPQDPYIREKFTRLHIPARTLAAEYFERFPKDRYLTEIETWRHPQSDNIEFPIKWLREPIYDVGRSCLDLILAGDLNRAVGCLATSIAISSLGLIRPDDQ
jgi:hypothetical protein